MADQFPTAYQTLGILPDATADDIVRAYRRLLRRHHPDSRDVTQAADNDDPAGDDAAESLKAIIEAYAVLRDPSRRADYDRRQATQKPQAVTYPAYESQSLLLGAGPVRWQQEPAPSRSVNRPALTHHEAIEQLMEVLRGRWLYW